LRDAVIGGVHQTEDDVVIEVEDARIKFSESYLKSVISELIDNALKFSDKGNRIQITGVQNENEYSIYVIDNGRGMSDQQISMLGFKTLKSENIMIGYLIVTICQ